MNPPLTQSSRNLAVVALFTLGVFLPACKTVVDTTTPGAVLYIRGELQATLDNRFDEVAGAANKALAELQFSNIEMKRDALVALLEARTVEDTRIHIRVEKITETFSTVRIRAGLLGDDKLAYIVFNKLKEQL